MKKILFPLATALMAGCLSLQSVMAEKSSIVDKQSIGYSQDKRKIPVKGEFIVPSTSLEGTAFTNTESCPIEVTFHAYGQWSYNPSIGLHTASGYLNALRAYPAYRLSGVPEGSLIVSRGNGNYEYVGQEKILRLRPKETIYFMINDDYQNNYGAGYADNQGKLSVEWNYSPCNSIAYTGDQGDPPRPIDSEGRRLHSAGIWTEQRERLKVQAGQGIHLVLRNDNIFQVDVNVRDTPFTAGALQSNVVIPPLGKADIVLSKFGSEPMTWDLLISSELGRETVFIVNWELYSTWVPGDPQNR